MKRCIYVGPTETYPWNFPGRHPLHYGMTGDCRGDEFIWSFRPDGQVNGSFVKREVLYIPSEDQTRHCPKPS